MGVLVIAGIGLGGFLEILLLSKRNKSAADRVLATWMSLIVVHLLLLYLYISGEIERFPFLLGVEQPLPLVHGVCLYLYTAYLTRRAPRNLWIVLLHGVPAIAIYLYLFSFFALPADQKIQIYREHGAGREVFMLAKRYAIALSGVGYVAASAVLLRRHRAAVLEQFSDLEKVNLRWLGLLTGGMGAIWFVVIFVPSEMAVVAGIVVFVFLIGYFGVRQAEIFVSWQDPAGGTDGKQKYVRSGLTDDAARDLHERLLRLMREEGAYRKGDLTIGDLASGLGVHPNTLSQVINQKEQKNFYDFVNAFRVEEFKNLIAQRKNRQFTLLALAYDCGFASKSSFHRYFKRATGQTPSEYLAAFEKPS